MRAPNSPLLLTLAALLLVSGLAASGSAGDDGRTLYRTNCKVCHAADSPHGEYTPMSLIQTQWERFFARKYESKHRDLEMPASGGKKVFEVITPEMLAKIKEFAIDHAADSEHPMTCGK